MSIAPLLSRSFRSRRQIAPPFPVSLERTSFASKASGDLPPQFTERVKFDRGPSATSDAHCGRGWRITLIGAAALASTLMSPLRGFAAQAPLRTLKTAREIIELNRSEA